MPVDFSTPDWLINYYHIIGTVSLFINSGTIYLVYFQSEKIDSFRCFLLVFQILCTVTDVHWTLLMQPVPLFPIIAAYCNGLLVRVFNVYGHYLMVTWTCLMVSQISALAWCFTLKHRTIGKVTNQRIFSRNVYILFGIYSVSTPILTFWTCFKTGVSRSAQMEYVAENYPQYFENFLHLPNFSIYEINGWFIAILLISTTGSFFSGSTFIFTTIDMLKMLKGLKLKVSGKSFRRYQMAVRSLLAQFVTSSLCLAPPVALMVLAVGKFEYGQALVQISFAIASLHSSVNAIVLIMTTMSYRKFILRKSLKILQVQSTT